MHAAALAKLRREARVLPFKLQAMVERYAEAASAGVHDPVKLLRHGANLLNHTYRRAVDGDGDTLATLMRDRVPAVQLAIGAELFSTAAMEIEQGPASPRSGTGGARGGRFRRARSGSNGGIQALEQAPKGSGDRGRAIGMARPLAIARAHKSEDHPRIGRNR